MASVACNKKKSRHDVGRRRCPMMVVTFPLTHTLSNLSLYRRVQCVCLPACNWIAITAMQSVVSFWCVHYCVLVILSVPCNSSHCLMSIVMSKVTYNWRRGEGGLRRKGRQKQQQQLSVDITQVERTESKKSILFARAHYDDFNSILQQ